MTIDKSARPVVPVILSGGSGTRLWPLSREAYPKQFLGLTGDLSPLQETLLRVADRSLYEKPVVICSYEHRFVVAEQARLVGCELGSIVTEPFGRNTAPAVCVAAEIAEAQNPDSAILVMPADHKIRDNDGLQKAFRTACAVAGGEHFVIFGAKAVSPATGYGYIHRGKEIETGLFEVAGFVEKPDEATATSYVASGAYDWNCGIFLFPAKTIRAEIEAFAPEIARQATAALQDAKPDLFFTCLDPGSFETCPSLSIDYAVMEKTKRALVVPMDCGWSDLGSWPGLWATMARDENGNAVCGDAVMLDASDCLVHSRGKLTTLLGVRNVAVVTTADAVLVADMAKTEEIRAVVAALRAQKRPEATDCHQVHRPWGWYESIASGQRFQVKHIFVQPGKSLSLQMHHHRAEHWIVVSGTALVQRGEDQLTVQTNESVFIPLGAKHRLTNPGKIDLHLIEVQSGDYFGEDDIVRFADDFGRTEPV